MTVVVLLGYGNAFLDEGANIRDYLKSSRDFDGDLFDTLMFGSLVRIRINGC